MKLIYHSHKHRVNLAAVLHEVSRNPGSSQLTTLTWQRAGLDPTVQDGATVPQEAGWRALQRGDKFGAPTDSRKFSNSCHETLVLKLHWPELVAWPHLTARKDTMAARIPPNIEERKNSYWGIMATFATLTLLMLINDNI